MARLGDKSDSGEVGRGREHIALPRNQSAAKRRIQEVFLRQFPGKHFTHLRSRLARRIFEYAGMLPGDDRLRRRPSDGESLHDGTAILRLVGCPLGIETRDEAVLHLMGIGEDVAFVEFDNVLEIVHASDEAIHSPRLNHVLPLSSEEFLVEDALQRWWAQFDSRVQGLAVGGVAYRLPGVFSAFSNQPLGVISFVHSQLWTQRPSSKQERQGYLRAQIEPPEQMSGTKSWRAKLEQDRARTLLWLARRQTPRPRRQN